MPKATCTKPECASPVQARGLCTKHYCRARRSGDLEALLPVADWHRLSEVSAEDRSATCSICGPTDVDVRKVGNKTQVECMTARREARRRAAKPRTPEQVRERHLRRFNVTPEWFERTLTEQGGCCAICGRVEHGGRNWNIDHDHACCPGPTQSCGKCVRGILCSPCNVALGGARDNIETLVKMIDYLHNSRIGA